MPNKITVDSFNAAVLLKKLRIEDLRDIRTVDTDLLLVFSHGLEVIWIDGALGALQTPDLILIFRDGTLTFEQLFKQIDLVEFSTGFQDADPDENVFCYANDLCIITYTEYTVL